MIFFPGFFPLSRAPAMGRSRYRAATNRISPHNTTVAAEIKREHLTMVPLSLYFKDGRVKVEIGMGRGRKKADKRQVIAERDSQREIQRALGRQRKGMA